MSRAVKILTLADHVMQQIEQWKIADDFSFQRNEIIIWVIIAKKTGLLECLLLDEDPCLSVYALNNHIKFSIMSPATTCLLM